MSRQTLRTWQAPAGSDDTGPADALANAGAWLTDGWAFVSRRSAYEVWHCNGGSWTREGDKQPSPASTVDDAWEIRAFGARGEVRYVEGSGAIAIAVECDADGAEGPSGWQPLNASDVPVHTTLKHDYRLTGGGTLSATEIVAVGHHGAAYVADELYVAMNTEQA
ncbi:MAG: hypothetical protein QM679_06675 [Patulibacter sp.]